jgi:hypothetical protein
MIWRIFAYRITFRHCLGGDLMARRYGIPHRNVLYRHTNSQTLYGRNYRVSAIQTYKIHLTS